MIRPQMRSGNFANRGNNSNCEIKNLDLLLQQPQPFSTRVISVALAPWLVSGRKPGPFGNGEEANLGRDSF